MSSEFVDIDAAFTELEFQSSPITVRVLGEDWEFPGLMPSMVPLRLARWQQEGKQTLDDIGMTESLALVGDLIPDTHLRAWSERGLVIVGRGGTMDPRMEMILQRLLDIYMGREAEIAGGSGEAQAPPPGPPPFSPTGPASKPISPESTDSTSPPT